MREILQKLDVVVYCTNVVKSLNVELEYLINDNKVRCNLQGQVLFKEIVQSLEHGVLTCLQFVVKDLNECALKRRRNRNRRKRPQ